MFTKDDTKKSSSHVRNFSREYMPKIIKKQTMLFKIYTKVVFYINTILLITINTQEKRTYCMNTSQEREKKMYEKFS